MKSILYRISEGDTAEPESVPHHRDGGEAHRRGREPHPYDVLPGGIRGGEEEGSDRPEAVLEFDGADRLSIRNGQPCVGDLRALQGNVSEPQRELFRAGNNKDIYPEPVQLVPHRLLHLPGERVKGDERADAEESL